MTPHGTGSGTPRHEWHRAVGGTWRSSRKALPQRHTYSAKGWHGTHYFRCALYSLVTVLARLLIPPAACCLQAMAGGPGPPPNVVPAPKEGTGWSHCYLSFCPCLRRRERLVMTVS